MTTPVKDGAEVTGSVPGHVDGVDVLDGGRRPGTEGVSVLGRVWSFFISMRTGLFIILILGVLTLVGTLVGQVSEEVLADPVAYKQWFEAGPKQKLGGWASVFDVLGLYHVFSTWYFRALFAILAVSILACSVNRAPRLWRVATKPRTSMNDAFFAAAPLKAEFVLPVGVDVAVERVKSGFKKDRFRVLDGSKKSKGADVYADKFRWGPFGTVVAHLSFLIILAGFVVSGTSGFKDNQVIAPIGVPVAVGHDTGLTVTAMSFQDSYYDNGSPKDYVSDLVVTKGGVQVARQETRVNTPLIVDGVWFHQAFFGVGADVTATKDGQTLYSQTVPLQWTSRDGQQSIGQFVIESAGVSVYVIQAASGQKLADLPAGSVAFEVHKAGVTDPQVQVVSQGKSTTIDGITYAFDRNRQYTGLAVTRDPGSWIVWLGSILLILGSYLTFFLPHRRVWVRVRPTAKGSSITVGSPIKRDPAFEPRFNDLVARIQSTES